MGTTQRLSLVRVVVENCLIAGAYWGISHLCFLLFRKMGVLPMPIWPAAALAFVVAFYRSWRVAPGIALGVILANYYSLGAPLIFAACIAIMNTLGPLLGAGLARRRLSSELNIQHFSDVIVFFLAAMIVTPMLTASGGIGFKCLLGLSAWETAPTAWLKWAMAHALGTLFFALPAFAFLKGSTPHE